VPADDRFGGWLEQSTNAVTNARHLEK